MTKYLFLCFALISACSLFAQFDDFTPMEWGKVPQADLDMTVYALDSSAHAVVLGDEGRLRTLKGDGTFEYSLNQFRRIKILNEAAIDEYANVELHYYHNDDDEKIRNIKAHTIAPDGTISEVSGKEIYKEAYNKYWTKVNFAFTNVQVGSVLEFKYNLNSEHSFTPRVWTFKEEIPVRSSYFEFRNEAPMTFTYLMQGAEYMRFSQDANGNELFEQDDMRIRVSGTKFFMQNAPAISEEPYMTTLDDYKVTVRFQCSEYQSWGTIYPVLSSWETAAKDLLDDDKIGMQFLRPARANKVVKASADYIDEAADEQDKLIQIHKFVTSNIRWDGKHRITTSTTPNDAYAKHEADLAAIQYTGLALLRHYGFDAHPAILSTRGNGAFIKQFPFFDQFNYVFLLVNINGSYIPVDMSDPYLSVGMLRRRALNHHAFLLKKENSSLIDISSPMYHNTYAVQGTINADASIDFSMKNSLQVYQARSMRKALNESTLEEIWKEKLPESVQIDSISCTNEEDIQKRLVINMEAKQPEAGFSNDDLLYVSPIIYSAFSENVLKSKHRSFPVDFPYPVTEKLVYNYAIPEGYVVEALPEKMIMELPNKDAFFKFQTQERAGKITIISTISIQKTNYAPDHYETIQGLFEAIAEKMEEQIVLRKL